MTDTRLKELLKDQIATISDDVQKKIEYLKHGKMFSYNYYKEDIYIQKLSFGQDNSLLSAFIGDSGTNTSNDRASFVNAFMGSTSQSDIVASPSRPTGGLTAKDRINNLNAKLAALRGVSMPGDYLKQ